MFSNAEEMLASHYYYHRALRKGILKKEIMLKNKSLPFYLCEYLLPKLFYLKIILVPDSCCLDDK